MRLIALSGYGGRAEHGRSAAAGFSAHLIKPVDLQQLDALFDAAYSAARPSA
jgi:CheY-like chemotaxis protein